MELAHHCLEDKDINPELSKVVANEEMIAYVDADISELIPSFLETRHQDIQTLLSALDQNDYGTVRFLGHLMKGDGGSFGFPPISEIGCLLEEAANNKNREEIRILVQTLNIYIAQVQVVYVQS
ncbi:MAG: Hpt domain-containing protein [Acidobacteriota bacterium]